MLFILLVVVSSVMMLDATPIYENEPKSQVLTYDTDNLPNSYKYHYDASDGSSRTEHGAYSATGNSDPALKVHGAVRWYNEKGHLYEMTYKAGKRGFRTIIKKIAD